MENGLIDFLEHTETMLYQATVFTRRSIYSARRTVLIPYYIQLQRHLQNELSNNEEFEPGKECLNAVLDYITYATHDEVKHARQLLQDIQTILSEN